MTGEVVDLSDRLGPVRDQGNRGTCLAFATTTTHEAARLRARGGEREDLSEELLYWACKQIDGDFQSGTRPESATRALRETGQPLSALWPYDRNRDDSNSSYQPPAEAVVPSALRRATLIPVAIDLGELQETLRGGHVIILAMELWDAFYDADGGMIQAPDRADLLGDGHAVTLVGFDEARGALRLRNSWGPLHWGDGGYAWLAADALPVICFGAWTVADDIDSRPSQRPSAWVRNGYQ
jgi:C1A family cysteine protease